MEAAQVATALMEAFNKSDWETFKSLCSPDVRYEEKGTGRNTKGVDAILEVAHAWKASFSDIRGNIFNQASAGATGTIEITWTGTNDGPLELPSGTIPATGKSVEFDDCQVYRVEDGKVVEFRNYGDFLTMLTQLGIIPGS